MALILDTGVVYAVLDRSDPDHEPCRRLVEEATEPLVIPSPVLPEVDYFASQQLGPKAMTALIRDIRSGAFTVEDVQAPDYERVVEILDRYADASVGFVDAAVLAVVERLDERKLASLDRRHFSLLRPRHVRALRLLP